MSHLTTVQEALQQARQQGLDRLDAQVLLLHALGRDLHDRAWLIAHDTDALPEGAAAAFAQRCQRRLEGEPLAYLVGQRAFHGLTLQVDARVLDPRPDTETLVDWALEVMQSLAQPAVLDLGTGSGAIALAIQHRRPDARIWALDASTDALDVATANAQRLGLAVRALHGHWLHPWPPTPYPPGVLQPALPPRWDLLISNPPYIRSDDPHLPALRHEPLQALASGPDGLQDLRRIVADAPAHLQSGGWLLLEHGWDQGNDVAALLQARGFARILHRHDLAGHVRCTGGQWGR